ncbi:hypothetical protein [Persephonella sp.]|uniref:hypothetical protein n=1 Tax=Persephonella sp. TaxID=2060922 RepID=UPI0025FC4296|nr:hypothetical protein [Persephonella sp.]
MRDFIKFAIGFTAGFVAVYKYLSKKEEKVISNPPEVKPFQSNGRMLEVLKKFNEIKQNI